MNILILGASGYTGSRIRQTLEQEFSHVYGTYMTRGSETDPSMYPYCVDQPETLEAVLKDTDPDIIISALRGDFEKQLEAHAIAARFLAAKADGRMIFLSTANVFDGLLDSVHFETDEPKAESSYGQYKIQCEKLLINQLGDRCIILRPPAIWGNGSRWLEKLVQDSKSQEPVPSLKNLFLNYTTDVQIAQWIVYIIRHDLRGIFHVGSRDILDFEEFHRELAAHLNLISPAFRGEGQKERIYQAVLPGRTEIPDFLQLSVRDIILSM